MSKPADKALNTILSKYPGASVSERGKSSLTADVGGGGFVVVGTIGPMHYQESGDPAWLPIDTGWQPTTGAWQYEMTTAPYQAYARDAFNVGTLVEYQAKTGEVISFQPLALNWRDENDSQQQIATPQGVATVVTDDVLSWPNGYGPGRSLEWHTRPSRFQKVLRVDAPTDLPALAGYLTGEVVLEVTYVFQFDATVEAFVDGAAWDRTATRATADSIEFRSATDDVLWYLLRPYVRDAADDRAAGSMSVYRQGAALHVSVRVPRTFLETAVFPVFLDWGVA